MISESSIWKHEVQRIVRSLRKRMLQKRWHERSHFNAERDIFVLAYLIRKLSESNKLSDELEQCKLRIEYYPAKPKQDGNGLAGASILDRWEVDKLYDFDNRQYEVMSITGVCNQFIHSFVFQFMFNESQSGIIGMLVSSDRVRSTKLYFIELPLWLQISESVVSDRIAYLKMCSDPNGELKIVEKRQ